MVQQQAVAFVAALERVEVGLADMYATVVVDPHWAITHPDSDMCWPSAHNLLKPKPSASYDRGASPLQGAAERTPQRA